MTEPQLIHQGWIDWNRLPIEIDMGCSINDMLVTTHSSIGKRWDAYGYWGIALVDD